MKSKYILFNPYGGSIINPLKLKMQATIPVAKITEEIGVIKLLEVILLVSFTIGLLVFAWIRIL